MRGHLVLVAVVVLVREITVLATVESDVEAQLLEQRRLKRKFLEKGCDKVKGSTSTIAQHAAFTGTKTQALILGKVFRKKLLIFKKYKAKYNVTYAFTKVDPPQTENIVCDPTARYRTADGSCNNLDNPTYGQSFIAMRRFLAPEYEDAVSTPRTIGTRNLPLPSPRKISTRLHTADPGPSTQSNIVSHMAMQWAQFLDHDITLTPIERGENETAISCCIEDFTDEAIAEGLDEIERPECFNISVPEGDRRFNRTCLNFVRSVQIENSEGLPSPAEQLNALTAFVDGSEVFGSTLEEQRELRSGVDGLLSTRQLPGQPDTSTLEFLPENDVQDCVTFTAPNFCFKAGDERVDEHMGLASMHTVWLREHNRIARELAKINTQWTDDEKLFQESRRIVGAMMQHITFAEFLPLVLPSDVLEKYGLTSSQDSDPYDPCVDASIRNAFATAAYRFGHSLIRTNFSELAKDLSPIGDLRLRNSFGNTSIIINSTGNAINTLTRGLATDPANSVDRHITPELTDQLFLDPETDDALDLMALNIQRGRDHGLPNYSDFRRFCGLSRISSFGTRRGGLVDHTRDARRALRDVYDRAVDIDLWPGGVSETPLPGGLLGPTFSCLVALQFQKLKTGDRFFYERQDDTVGFTPAQLTEIRKVSLARVMCDNTDTVRIQKEAMKRISPVNPVVDCSVIPTIDLSVFTS